MTVSIQRTVKGRWTLIRTPRESKGEGDVIVIFTVEFRHGFLKRLEFKILLEGFF